MVDVEGQLRVEVAERIVRQRSQVQDRVEPFEVAGLRVADVGGLRRGLGCRSEIAADEIPRVHAHDPVPARLQHGGEHRTDEPLVTGDQDSH